MDKCSLHSVDYFFSVSTFGVIVRRCNESPKWNQNSPCAGSGPQPKLLTTGAVLFKSLLSASTPHLYTPTRMRQQECSLDVMIGRKLLIPWAQRSDGPIIRTSRISPSFLVHFIWDLNLQFRMSPPQDLTHKMRDNGAQTSQVTDRMVGPSEGWVRHSIHHFLRHWISI